MDNKTEQKGKGTTRLIDKARLSKQNTLQFSYSDVKSYIFLMFSI